jgi:CRP-like cAMP-binding protein
MDIKQLEDIIENNPDIYKMLKYCPYNILRHWQPMEYSAGDIICSQGEKYNCFYIIVHGYADIYFMSESGKKYSQAIYKKGDYIGELEIFDRKPYSCFVEALTDLKLIKIARDIFIEWLQLDRNICVYIIESLCNQFYKLSKKAGEDTLYSLKNRLCNYLLSFDNQSTKGIKSIKIELEREKLSDRFAVTPRSINRVLLYLRKKGIIDIVANFIIVKDLEELAREEKYSRNEE